MFGVGVFAVGFFGWFGVCAFFFFLNGEFAYVNNSFVVNKGTQNNMTTLQWPPAFLSAQVFKMQP